MCELLVHQFRCRSDNFGLLLYDPRSKLCASIDTPDGDTIWRELGAKGWQLTHIFNTHHHYDHVPGNEMLKEHSGCTIIGAKNDAKRIPGIDELMEDGDKYDFGANKISMLETPGHTLGSVCYFIEPEKILFTGDTLFSMGCGRLFEGSAELMWQSMQKILALPDDTQIYCGHEYTLSNAEFALEVEPDNLALQQRTNEVRTLRHAHKATLPVSLATEKATNPFLRSDSVEIKKKLGLQGHPALEVFTAIRSLKDNF
ncbi:MAG: hydroxyacylglutathione hydrolase [bacterium]|nr:hydroxyacylglutathione hydrolase [bacterium]